ncbi:MAG TPA: CBS domain-containing protein [Caulobacteraceae bacterium]|nr:CBS domain-containing protein [Caulobacteraceae bacterium]
MRVQDVIKTKGAAVITVADTIRVDQAVRVMQEQAIGALVVVASDGRLRGVISEREVILALARHGKAALDLAAGRLLLAACPAVAPDDTVRDAMAIMTERRVRHLPVISNHSIVGLISLGDTVKARLTEKIAENLVLRDMARWPAAAAA